MVSPKELHPDYLPDENDLALCAKHAPGLILCIDNNLKGREREIQTLGFVTVEIILLVPELLNKFPKILKNEILSHYLKKLDNPDGWSSVTIEISGNILRITLEL